jgi:hypothetical protein
MESDYSKHPVFNEIEKLGKFYENLSYSVFQCVSMGTGSISNIDSYVFTSMQGTLESINNVLIKGRISDAYTLLRKYHDAATTNIYVDLYLEEHFGIDNFIVKKIDGWLKGQVRLPPIREMNSYIEKSSKVSTIHKLLYKDKQYSEIRKRCNDYTHYNFYKIFLLNDNQIYLPARKNNLETFLQDVLNLFILHFSLLFSIKDNYLMSTDYVDCLDCGLIPEPDSLYSVAPFIQEVFDTIIKSNRMDIAIEIKKNTSMQLE